MSWIDDYRAVKRETPDALVLWRVMDFYEAIEGDAVTLSRALDLMLTKISEKVQMAGFPAAKSRQYVATLIELGYKVAVVEPAHTRMENNEQG